MQSVVQEERRNEVHDKRSSLLQPRSDNKRRRSWGRPCRFRQNGRNWLAVHVSKLGPELAE